MRAMGNSKNFHVNTRNGLGMHFVQSVAQYGDDFLNGLPGPNVTPSMEKVVSSCCTRVVSLVVLHTPCFH